MTLPLPLPGSAGPLSIDPARELRHQLWLGCGCFVLMLAGLLLALYAMRVDRELHDAHDRAITYGVRALQIQQALQQLQRRGEQALSDEVERIAAGLGAAEAFADVATARETASRRTLLDAIDACVQLHRQLRADVGGGALAPAAAAERWRREAAPLIEAAEGALRALLDDSGRRLTGEHQRAQGVARFARLVLVALALLTALLGLLFAVLALRAARAQKHLVGQLDALAHTDGLTGVPNRRGLDERLPLELARADRLGYPLAVVMLDLDHFKRFNDRRGHAAGDRLLRGAAQGWRGQLRPTDILARYGGEEFTLVLPACEAPQALQLIDRLRPLTPEAQTFSAGIALYRPGEGAVEVLARADAALLAAKRGGRDRSELAPELPQMPLPLAVSP